MDIKKTVELHAKWLRSEDGGERANLSGANLSGADLSGASLRGANLSGANLRGASLRGANLSGANLSGANLSGADLSGADLRGANLSGANLSGADLSGADLSRANLSGANLSGANLSRANLSGANLSGADLSDADLSDADLSGADLSGADLSRANLSGANLSGADGLLSQSDWLSGFEKTTKGIIVFKAIGNTPYSVPEHWNISPGSILSEVVNPNRTDRCGCGVNFGTKEYVKSEYPESDHWKCLIRWEWLADVVVPYNTDGKGRCELLELIEIVK